MTVDLCPPGAHRWTPDNSHSYLDDPSLPTNSGHEVVYIGRQRVAHYANLYYGIRADQEPSRTLCGRRAAWFSSGHPWRSPADNVPRPIPTCRACAARWAARIEQSNKERP